jgi:hypothetical protein
VEYSVTTQANFTLRAKAQRRALHTLFKQLTNLATEQGLYDAPPRSPVVALARAHVFTTLPLLDGAHKGLLLQFLHEALLIGGSPAEEGAPIHARLSLHWADLRHAALPFGNLGWSSLINADLSHADLRGVSFTSANLSGSNLSHANLRGAKFTNCNLMLATLEGADLDAAYLGTARIIPAQIEQAQVTERTTLPWSANPAPTTANMLT